MSDSMDENGVCLSSKNLNATNAVTSCFVNFNSSIQSQMHMKSHVPSTSLLLDRSGSLLSTTSSSSSASSSTQLLYNDDHFAAFLSGSSSGGGGDIISNLDDHKNLLIAPIEEKHNKKQTEM